MSLLFYHIRDLRRIHRFITLSVAKTIATALVSSRLDYCISLLYNTATKDIAKLQRVQKFVPLLETLALHWLPVHYRIIFKICTIAYQALSSTQSAYPNSMLTPSIYYRQLRSTSSLHSLSENESWDPSFLSCRTNCDNIFLCHFTLRVEVPAFVTRLDLPHTAGWSHR